MSWAAPQTELRDAGLPGAKRRDADTRVAFSLGTYLLAKQKKVPRLPGRDPASVADDNTVKFGDRQIQKSLINIYALIFVIGY